MMCYLSRSLPLFALWLLLISQFMTPAYAETGMQLQVATTVDVLTCSASLPEPPESLERALREGSEISVNWHINVDAKRKYWLNKSIASIEINRRVIPDLVSQSWQLVDKTGGITKRVFKLKEAIAFLTKLEHFPVIDRSLLNNGQAYIVTVGISEHEGESKDNWWGSWFGSENSSAKKDFTLP